MKILVDGDSCNVLKKIERIAREFDISCHIYVNFCRKVQSDYSEIHLVDCSKDSADFAIINNCDAGDIIITNDSGLAAMVLSKNAFPIKTNGMEFTKNNIMKYLNSRYMRGKEVRRTNRKQVKKLPLSHDKYDTHPSFSDALINRIGSVPQFG